MADPFRPDSKSQLLREAQVGLSIVAILLALLVYIAFYRITGQGRHIPEHVRNAPVAQLVWPGQQDNRVAVREIEMTPQEFRDRMPKPSSIPVAEASVTARTGVERNSLSSSASDYSKNANVNSKKQSPYNPRLTPSSMAELKTSRPKTPLEKPNFSPSSNAVDSELSKVKVAGAANSRPESTAALDPFKFEPRIDPHVEQASLESEDNNFKVELPTERQVDVMEEVQPKLPLSKTSQPISLRPESTNLGGADAVSNEFNPFNFKVEPPKLVEQTPSIDFKGADVRSSIDSADDNEILAAGSFVPVPDVASKPDPEDLADPFKDPVIDTARPIVDVQKEPIAAQRLPRATEVSPSEESDSFEEHKKSSSLEYIAQQGDSFWSIAQSTYNDGRYFRALYKYNEPSVPDFDSLQPGTTIATPMREDLVKLWPDLCPAPESSEVNFQAPVVESQHSRIYVTRRGDTVFDIARQRLGQASRYAEILKLNKVWLGQEVSHLTPLEEGLRIVIPE